MTRRLDEIASLFEDRLGGQDDSILNTAVNIKAKLDRPKYEELLQRAQDVGPGAKTESFVERAGKSAQNKPHSEVAWDEMKKEAAGRRKVQMSRKKIVRDINDNRIRYRDHRNNLDGLEKERERLDSMIESTRAGVQKTRKDMLFLSDVLQTLNLADSNYAVFYENERQDVAYILDKSKEEYHVKFEDGELIVTPWKDYMREMRAARRTETGEDLLSPEGDEALEEAIEEDVADSDFIPGIDRIEDSAPRSEDETITSYPNLRFAE